MIRIWPFTELKKLRDELAVVSESEVQRSENFMLLHGQLNTQTINIASLTGRNNDLEKALDKVNTELEIERMKLVACGVGAMSNTPASAAKHRVAKSSPYYCASVGDVYDLVDREMKLREDLHDANDRAFRASEAHVVTMGNFNMALDVIENVAKAGDFIAASVAVREAERFHTAHRGTKVCIKCGSIMIPLHSEDKKLCSNGACGHEVEWKLEEGQQYQYKRNVEPFVEDRSRCVAELDPPRADIERL